MTDRNTLREGTRGYPITKTISRKRGRMTFERIAPWAITILTLVIFGDKFV